MTLTFVDFVRLGADQWRVQRSSMARLFFRLLGPLGTHARIRNMRVLNALRGLDLNGRRLLDLGSGHGYVLYSLARRFPQACLEGVELDEQQVSECRLIAGLSGFDHLQFRQGTFEDLRAALMPDLGQLGVYDAIITIDVLEHVPDDEGMLRFMAQALKPGGLAVIHVPLRHQLQRRIFLVFRQHTVHDHVRDEYTEEEIRTKVEQAGLKVEHLSFGFGWWGELSFEINNLFWDRRWLRNLAALLTLPLALVAGYIDARAELPEGNSILLVAKKQSAPPPAQTL